MNIGYDSSIKITFDRVDTSGSRSIARLKAVGQYRDGSSGANDAKHIMGSLHYAIWNLAADHWLIDLSELTYEWGDEMTWILDAEEEKGVKRAAIIVGPKNRKAISGLIKWNPDTTYDCTESEGIFNDESDAIAYLQGS